MSYSKARQARRSRLTPKQEAEYHKLNREYYKITGKWFKRNGKDMHDGLTKLQAIKLRMDLAEKEDFEEDENFNLGGAL